MDVRGLDAADGILLNRRSNAQWLLFSSGSGARAVSAGLPYATSGPRAVELVQNGTLKTYASYPHGMPTTHADTINNDLLAFIQS